MQLLFSFLKIKEFRFRKASGQGNTDRLAPESTFTSRLNYSYIIHSMVWVECHMGKKMGTELGLNGWAGFGETKGKKGHSK